jgi:hypothetical protein
MLIFQLIFAVGKVVYILSTLLAALKWQREAQTSPHYEGYCPSAVELEFPPPNYTQTTGSPCTEGNTTLESCYHYDSFMFGHVTGMKTAGRSRMAVSVTEIMLDVIFL